MLSSDMILAGVGQAKANTWGSRYHPTFPSLSKDGSIIKLVDGNLTMEINPFDEIVLTILVKFCFCPVWLIKYFYSKESNILGDNTAKENINNWITFGLVWLENAVTGAYLRPTYQLFTLFGMEPYPYTNIPFNTLTHTIAEEDIMFQIMSGQNPIFEREKENLLPRVSELGFDDDNFGTNIISEEDFRNPKLYTDEGIKELSQSEHDIDCAIENKSQVSPELYNFRLFTLVKKINNTGEIKKDYKFHVPDLVIPCLRQNGLPKSIAIEVELTNKRGNYIETMERYKNNNKFGIVYWFCTNPGTVNSLRESYKAIGGTGNTKCSILEYMVPFPEEV